MKPVDQTRFGFDYTRDDCGDCFSACVASLLELPLGAVPIFMEKPNWLLALNTWLKQRGFWAVTFELTEGGWSPEGYCILGGKSPRATGDEMHAVVGFGRKVVHDPHPSRAGLVDLRDVTLLIPFDPSHRPI